MSERVDPMNRFCDFLKIMPHSVRSTLSCGHEVPQHNRIKAHRTQQTTIPTAEEKETTPTLPRIRCGQKNNGQNHYRLALDHLPPSACRTRNKPNPNEPSTRAAEDTGKTPNTTINHIAFKPTNNKSVPKHHLWTTSSQRRNTRVEKLDSLRCAIEVQHHQQRADRPHSDKTHMLLSTLHHAK